MPTDAVTQTAAVVAAISLFGLLIRFVGPWRKQISEAEERLRREAMDGKARCEAELRIVRHRERGGRQIIYSLLHLFDMPAGPRRDGALQVIRGTLDEMERAEAHELGTVIGVGGEHDHPERKDG